MKRDLTYWTGQDGYSHRPALDKRKILPFRTGQSYYGPTIYDSPVERASDWYNQRMWPAHLMVWAFFFFTGAVFGAWFVL